MNKKEISEIKKQLTPDRCAISKIALCYVDGEKNKVSVTAGSFSTLEEEEQFKYFAIIRRVLSSSLGRSTLNMEFSLDQEETGTPHDLLMQLNASALEDNGLLDKFYDAVIAGYDTAENYLIVTIHADYDVPGKAKDNSEMFDASEEVYSYILSAVCPVSLAKPALAFDAEANTFRDRIRDRIVAAPVFGFLFPAFNDRSTDIHSLLFYSKKADELPTDYIDSVLGCALPVTAGAQKETFAELIQETLGDRCDFTTVKNIHDQLHELTEKAKDSPDPVMLDEGDIKAILEQSGADDEKMENFAGRFEKAAGENMEFNAGNLTDGKKFEVHTPDIEIRVSPDRTDLIEQKEVDGRSCLVIPVTDEVTVNGIKIRDI